MRNGWKNLDDFLSWFRNDKDITPYDVRNVNESYYYWLNYFKDVVFDLITIEKCLKSMPSKQIKHQLIETGHCVVVNHPKFGLITTYSTLFNYNLYGEFLNADLYNPYKGFYTEGFKVNSLEIGKDCEVIYIGDTEAYVNNKGGYINKLNTLLCRYARMMADVESSIDTAIINSRRPYVFTAKNQQTKDALVTIFRNVIKGQGDFVVEDNDIMGEAKSLKNVDYVNGIIGELLDAREKILKMFLQQLGIYTTDDKSERLITAEVEQENKNVKPFIYSLLKSINEGLDKVNQMYGTEMHASLNQYVYDSEVNVNEI